MKAAGYRLKYAETDSNPVRFTMPSPTMRLLARCLAVLFVTLNRKPLTLFDHSTGKLGRHKRESAVDVAAEGIASSVMPVVVQVACVVAVGEAEVLEEGAVVVLAVAAALAVAIAAAAGVAVVVAAALALLLLLHTTLNPKP